MTTWFMVHSETGEVVGAILSMDKPDFVREPYVVKAEEEVPRAALEEYGFWAERP